MNNNKLETISNLFENNEIRSIWNSEKEEYFFSVVDVVSALTNSPEPRKYWSVLKSRLKKEGSEVTTNCSQLKMLAPDGKIRLRDAMTTRDIFRLIESVPSAKAEPFKLWLANLGSERIDEVFDPEIAVNRAVEYYRNKGYNDEWIKARLNGIVDRFKLTDVWKEGGITKPIEYALLTNEIYKGWSGMKASEYKKLKGIRKESLRDNMTDIEVALTNIGEIATRDIAREEHPQGLKENLNVAKRGGGVAKGAKDLYEKETRKSAISKSNSLNYKYIDEQKQIKNKEVKMMNNNENTTKTNINWYPGHMAKTKRQIIQDLKLIDVVIEILDARIPIASQNPDVKSMIGNKKKIVLLNKCDLADQKENIKWVKYFEKQGIKAILTDANMGKGIAETIREIENTMKNDLQDKASKGRVGKSIRVLVLGIPNVGKSSFINRISKKVSAQVGNKPGVTKQKQWIRVSNNIELLDTPGVLWPKFQSEEVALNLSYIGTIKDDILEKTEIAFYLLKFLINNYKTNVAERYKITELDIDTIMQNNNQMENDNILEIMNLIGKKRGAIVSGGNVDEEKVANILLDDFRTGKIGRISLEKVK